ncbi:hypothetical protein ACP275_12G091700 [Erythranthe tilingii]
MQMESIFDSEFPGFLPANIAPRDEFVAARRAPLSRLQRRAPGPLQLKPASTSEVKPTGGNNKDSSPSIVDSCYSSKDPIPLLSPLVLPSMLDSPLIRHESIVSNKSR